VTDLPMTLDFDDFAWWRLAAAFPDERRAKVTGVGQASGPTRRVNTRCCGNATNSQSGTPQRS